MPVLTKLVTTIYLLSNLFLLTACSDGTTDPNKGSSQNPTESSIPAIMSTISPSPKATAAPTPTPTPIATEHVNVVLIGSEMEGLYLARAAADEGLTVKIIDTRSEFGGQLLQGQMLFLDEAKDGSGKSLLQGRVKELFTGFKGGSIRKLSEFESYVNDKLVGSIPVESGIHIDKIDTATESDGQETVQAITYKDKDGVSKRIEADYFVENTDHSALISGLKATRLPSSDSFYGVSHTEYMAAGLMMKFKNVDWNKFNKHFNSLTAEEKSKLYGGGNVSETFAIGLTGMSKRYTASNDRVFLRGLNALHQRNGDVLINALLVYNVDPTDPKSIAEAVELGSAEMPGILKHFRKSIVGWENAELNGIPSYPYIREHSRYETELVLKPSDILGGRMHWDDVSIAGYPLDLQGVSAARWGIEMGRPDKYGMPLRSFQLKNYTNVLTAGKNVGANVIAYGSARIQPNTALAAESIGIILGQIQGKKQLKALNEEDMKDIHQYMAKKYNIKLTGIKSVNKVANWNEDELAKLDVGEVIFTSYKPKASK